MNRYTAEINYFADRAKEFVSWCQMSHAGKEADVFKSEALPMLSILYAAAWMLPQTESRTSLPETPPVLPEHLQSMSDNFKGMPFQLYWEIVEPAKMEGEALPICADLMEDLQKIYTDLLAGLWHLEQGDAEAAVVEWLVRFRAQWGRHATNALHALHLYQPKVVFTDPEF